MRVCAQPGCAELYPDRNTYCPTHRRAADKNRGTREQRGYDWRHRQLRKQWEPKVATGTVRCAKPTCGRPIRPNEAWDLGHVPGDRTRYRGPEHLACNRSTATPGG